MEDLYTQPTPLIDATKTLNGLILGKSSELPPHWHFIFAQSGLLHLFCVSGLHFGVLFSLSYLSIQKLMPQRVFARSIRNQSLPPMTVPVLAFFVSIVFLFFYLWELEISFPAARAMLGILFAITAQLLGIRFDRWSILLFVAVLGTLTTSSSIVSILLSISAVSGFLLFHNRLKQKYLLVSIAPWIASAPIIIFYFHHLPLLAPIFNALFLPFILVSIFLPLGFWLCLESLNLSNISVPLSRFVIHILNFWVETLEPFVMHRGVALWVPRHEWLLSTIVIFVLLMATKCASRKAKILLITVALIAFIHPTLTNSTGTRAYQLDVGQGDALLTIDPENHAQLLDTGKRGYKAYPAKISSELGALAVPTINSIILTHLDNDHSGGLGAVLLRHRFETKRKTDGLWLPLASLYSSKSLDVIALAHRYGVPIHVLPENQWQAIGELTKCYSLSRPFQSNRNDHSPLCRVRINQKTLISSGDATAAKERLYAHILGSEILGDLVKLSHHGSKSSSDPIYLKQISPKWGLVSAGRKNRYQHPHPEVIDRLRRMGVHVLDTRIRGRLALHQLGTGERIQFFEWDFFGNFP